MDPRIQLGDMLNAIGQHLANIIGEHPNGTYLFAEVDGATYGAGVFRDDGTEIKYFDPSESLFKALIELWEFGDADKKWAVLHYEVKDDQFDARFEYRDQLDPEEFSFDRRERALQERYGERAVVYPPPTSPMRRLTLDDLSDD